MTITYDQIIQLFNVGLIDKTQAIELLQKEAYLPVTREGEEPPEHGFALTDRECNALRIIMGGYMGAYSERDDMPVDKETYISLLAKLDIQQPERYWLARWDRA